MRPIQRPDKREPSHRNREGECGLGCGGAQRVPSWILSLGLKGRRISEWWGTVSKEAGGGGRVAALGDLICIFSWGGFHLSRRGVNDQVCDLELSGHSAEGGCCRLNVCDSPKFIC